MIRIEITGTGNLHEVAGALSLTAHQLRQLDQQQLKQGIQWSNGSITVNVQDLENARLTHSDPQEKYTGDDVKNLIRQFDKDGSIDGISTMGVEFTDHWINKNL